MVPKALTNGAREVHEERVLTHYLKDPEETMPACTNTIPNLTQKILLQHLPRSSLSKPRTGSILVINPCSQELLFQENYIIFICPLKTCLPLPSRIHTVYYGMHIDFTMPYFQINIIFF